MRCLVPFLLLAPSAFAADGAALATAGDLPANAQALRDKGMDADQVTATLKAAQAGKLSAGDTATLFASMAPLVEKHGPVEKFDEMLAERLTAGVTGEDLTKAVKEAHEKGGKAPAEPAPGGAKPAPAKPAPAPQPAKLTRPAPGGAKPAPGGKPAPAPAPGRLTRPGGGR